MAAAQPTAGNRPNIIFIMTDDHAAHAIGSYGSRLNATPNLSARTTVARLLQQGGYYTGMIRKWHLGSDPVGFDHWEILPGQGVYFNPVFYTAASEKTYTGRCVTDVITGVLARACGRGSFGGVSEAHAHHRHSLRRA